jgi:1,4-dihydroxy-2-naphthoate octaprenyltransferase
MSQRLEPSLARLPHPLMRYFVATRPAFLSVTFIGVLLGLASASLGGIRLDPLQATITMLFALLAHAGANVINDYYDARSGCDAANDERIFPFTGGSRVIQNGVLSLQEAGRFGYTLLAWVIPAGLWLTATSGSGLIAIGMIGLFTGWAYSAPPAKLQARGLGEFGITAAWLLIVIGSDFVQRHSFSFAPIAAGLGFALLVANVLYINQFPDVKADTLAGKHTLVVRLGTQRARWGYVLIASLCYGWVLAMVALGQLPLAALFALLPAIASFKAALNLARHAATPAALLPGITLTILAAVLHGLLLAAALVLTAP